MELLILLSGGLCCVLFALAGGGAVFLLVRRSKRRTPAHDSAGQGVAQTLDELVATSFVPGGGGGVMSPKHEVRIGPDAEATGAEAVAMSGFGLNLESGERVLATVVRESKDSGDVSRAVLAVTNQRTIASGWTSCRGGLNGIRESIDHTAILSSDSNYGLRTFFRIRTADGEVGDNLIYFFSEYRRLGAFFRGLASLPHEARSSRLPLPETSSEDDPAGALSAIELLWDGASETASALQDLAARTQAQQLPVDEAKNFVRRLVVADRCQRAGPAGRYGVGFTPLALADLEAVLTTAFGAPPAISTGDNGERVMTFPFSPDNDTIGPALRALGMTSYFVVGIGYSLVGGLVGAALRKPPLTEVVVTCREEATGTVYMLDDNMGTLHQNEAMIAGAVGQLIAARALPVLVWRCKVGWEPPLASAAPIL